MHDGADRQDTNRRTRAPRHKQHKIAQLDARRVPPIVARDGGEALPRATIGPETAAAHRGREDSGVRRARCPPARLPCATVHRAASRRSIESTSVSSRRHLAEAVRADELTPVLQLGVVRRTFYSTCSGPQILSARRAGSGSSKARLDLGGARAYDGEADSGCLGFALHYGCVREPRVTLRARAASAVHNPAPLRRDIQCFVVAAAARRRRWQPEPGSGAPGQALRVLLLPSTQHRAACIWARGLARWF